MKKKTILLIIAVSAYCWLFYGQSTGINAILFNLLLIILLLVLDQTLIRSKSWLFIAFGTIVTGVGALLYGNFLSAFGNVVSLLLLANLSLNKSSSLIFTLFQTVSSYVMIPYAAFEKAWNGPSKDDLETEEATELKFNASNLLKFIIPLIILTVFFMIYKASNPVFDQFIDQINFDFFSWNFVFFLAGGLILLYGFFYQRKLESLVAIDLRNGNQLVRSQGATDFEFSKENKKEFSFFSDLKKEFSAAIMTFVLLNLLLLLVNVLDLQFIFGGNEHSGMDYSKYVHQGINSSIFSILIAIFVTLYFFRGDLNFVAKNKQLKYLAMIWILLNAILLATCVHKNFSYIAECGLTHKRIGVYFYLFLTFIGLVTTWIKISNLKSNWFLMRKNMWSLYLVLIVSSLFNWNKIIVDYNLKYKSSVEREYYLFKLGDTGLPVLQSRWRVMTESNDYGSYYYASDVSDFEYALHQRTMEFTRNYKNTGWQSWNLEDQRIYHALQQTKHPKRAK